MKILEEVVQSYYQILEILEEVVQSYYQILEIQKVTDLRSVIVDFFDSRLEIGRKVAEPQVLDQILHLPLAHAVNQM